MNGKPATTAGNYLDFPEPLPITNRTAQVAYCRQVRPPLMVQAPVDCDYGDGRVHANILWDDTPEVIERFFRFEVGGNLTPIDAPREPPILSDSLLNEMRANGSITPEEFNRATSIYATSRYQAVRFGDYIKTAFSRDRYLDITPEFRQFLFDLHRRIQGVSDGI